MEENKWLDISGCIDQLSNSVKLRARCPKCNSRVHFNVNINSLIRPIYSVSALGEEYESSVCPFCMTQIDDEDLYLLIDKIKLRLGVII